MVQEKTLLCRVLHLGSFALAALWGVLVYCGAHVMFKSEVLPMPDGVSIAMHSSMASVDAVRVLKAVLGNSSSCFMHRMSQTADMPQIGAAQTCPSCCNSMNVSPSL